MSLSFSGTAQTQSVDISDPGFTGAYTVSGCSGVASYGQVRDGMLAVTSMSTGFCQITISDVFQNQTTVSITVQTLTIPIN